MCPQQTILKQIKNMGGFGHGIGVPLRLKGWSRIYRDEACAYNLRESTFCGEHLMDRAIVRGARARAELEHSRVRAGQRDSDAPSYGATLSALPTARLLITSLPLPVLPCLPTTVVTPFAIYDRSCHFIFILGTLYTSLINPPRERNLPLSFPSRQGRRNEESCEFAWDFEEGLENESGELAEEFTWKCHSTLRYKSSIFDKFFINFFNMVTRTKKIFVGGLSAPTTLEDVKNYFEQFGPLVTLSMYRTSSPFPLVSQNRAALSTTVIHGIYIV
ncbi:RNA-binding protein Musashi like protein Rbp6 [Cyphomyrmex costatus]|uniref:RNA-binding protein Musashi like protein Rbp6 n=1 Tax=Cyphomyrmex costatus TaxID=456900 RepID=A0A195CL56_9HYME|nr:RNA-binding protein Musashi like protein Rbp6 [Cyphomyrmex costatus]